MAVIPHDAVDAPSNFVTLDLAGEALRNFALDPVETDPAAPTLGQVWYNHITGRVMLNTPTGPTQIAFLSGTTAASESHTFFNSAVWVVNHSLIFQPSVTTATASGERYMTDVDYASPTQIVITHAVPTTGTVYLS